MDVLYNQAIPCKESILDNPSLSEKLRSRSGICYNLVLIFQRRQLLSLDVLGTFIQVALDEGPGPTIKYQYVELHKLYSVVSTLIRCCDLTPECNTCPDSQVTATPYQL